jgi:hypothetical protein
MGHRVIRLAQRESIRRTAHPSELLTRFRVILIFGWSESAIFWSLQKMTDILFFRVYLITVGARAVHLHKYTAAYAKRYPNAAQILVECPVSTFMKRRSPIVSLC